MRAQLKRFTHLLTATKYYRAFDAAARSTSPELNLFIEMI